MEQFINEQLPELLNNLLDYLVFMFQRLDLLSLVDVALVSAVFFVILLLLRGTQAMVLLRGGLLLIALLGVLTSLEVLPAFSWLVSNTLPALLLAIPVIFAPEIRRGLERLGRTGSLLPSGKNRSNIGEVIETVISATSRMSDRKHGALIVLQRLDSLEEYVQTGVRMGSQVTPELLLQIFYPNTPLHDGAVIISGSRILAAACVLPLSASGILTRSPERAMGLRHRAAIGISEVTDAVTVLVSEENGSISIAHGGRMIRRLEPDRLRNVLMAFFRPFKSGNGFVDFLKRLFPNLIQPRGEAG